jgi:hypothetical protein
MIYSMLSAINDWILHFGVCSIFLKSLQGITFMDLCFLSGPSEKQCLLLGLKNWTLLAPLLETTVGLYATQGGCTCVD